MLKEFREFAVSGNMLDLAIGVVLGGAFGGVVNSIVSDLLMPIIGLATKGMDFKNQFMVLNNPDPSKTWTSLEELQKAGGSALGYGQFITVVLNFAIVAFALFIIVKGINKMKRAKAAEEAAPAVPPADVLLLTEIRDLLKK